MYRGVGEVCEVVCMDVCEECMVAYILVCEEVRDVCGGMQGNEGE